MSATTAQRPRRLLAYINPLDETRPYCLPDQRGTGYWLHWCADQMTGVNHTFGGAIVMEPLGRWPRPESETRARFGVEDGIEVEYTNGKPTGWAPPGDWLLRFDQLHALRRRGLNIHTDVLEAALWRLRAAFAGDLLGYMGVLTGDQQGPSYVQGGTAPAPEARFPAYRLSCLGPLACGALSTIIYDGTGTMPGNAPEYPILSSGPAGGVEHMAGRDAQHLRRCKSLTIIGPATDAQPDLLTLPATDRALSPWFAPMEFIQGEPIVVDTERGVDFHAAARQGDIGPYRRSARAMVVFGCSVALSWDLFLIPGFAALWARASAEWATGRVEP